MDRNRIRNIKYLLRDINIVRKKIEERENNEDNFNMFTILRKESDEVYLNFRVLSALLDPNGPHRFETIFLDSFIKVLESKFKYDVKSLEVYPNNQNRSEYKEIDICFIDRIAKKAVMIENKIYHVDTKS
ncbi:PD-(D/E)XK nuclease family protein [uncultured Bacteroides sp.]|uniref:PD-(D/E)XK nuclease family protein n=1 Tax=uncultured Bacteroides sp. TaxID=162156 RepID=UPI002623BA0C|nr:PD-(D/E)XK nuclease family protein [uncultured Bacteroides sp.]